MLVMHELQAALPAPDMPPPWQVGTPPEPPLLLFELLPHAKSVARAAGTAIAKILGNLMSPSSISRPL
jgi:hypothetical protein